MRRRDVIAALAAGAAAAPFGAVGAEPNTSPFAIDTLTFEGPDFDARKALAAGMTGGFMDLRAFPRIQPVARAELQHWAEAAATPGVAIRLVRSASDFEAARAAGQFAVVLDCQDAAILEQPGDDEAARLKVLQEFYDLGLRGLQLTYNDRNDIGSGYWEDTQVPLSLYGRHLVEAMNKIGMLIDVSHCDEMTTLDTVRHSSRPIAVTHAGCLALDANPRNKSDTVIRALADRGGYFGVFNMSLWLTSARTSSVATVADHIDHVAKIGGVDLVGFGSDHGVFGEPLPDETWVVKMRAWAAQNAARGRLVGDPPTGHVYAADLNGPDRLQRLASELRRRGYRQDAIDKVLGLNFIRVFRGACG